MTIKNTESSALSGKQTTGLSLVKRLPSWFSYLDLKSYYCRSARGLKAWCERDRAAAHRGPHPNSTGHRAFPFLTMEWDVYGMLPASFREGSISCLFGKGTNMLHIATDLPPSLDFRSMGLGGVQPLSWDSFQDFRKSYSWSCESPPLCNRQNEQIKISTIIEDLNNKINRIWLKCREYST